MKSTCSLIAIALLFVATTTVFAQTTPSQRLMTVNIPFSFAAGDQSLPAGEYLVLTVTPERSIRIVSTDGEHSAIVNTLPNYAKSPSENSRLVFHRYGNEYFLTQVRTVGQNVTRNPMSSKRAMALASSGEKPETRVVIALADGR